MDESLITQCPHCQTSFRLTQAQRQAAGGLVRCGVCLKVFDCCVPAASPPPSDPVATDVAPSTSPRQPESDAPETIFDWSDPPINLDDIDLDEELAKLQEQEQHLEDAYSEPLPPAENENEDALSAVLPEEESDSPSEPLESLETDDREDDNDSIDEHLEALQEGPLKLKHDKPDSRWLANTIWLLLILLALAGLAGQYVFYHYEELSRQDDYRPWLGKFCETFDCVLPPSVDVSQIKSSNLTVRSHPEFSGALIVDAIIYNRASFAQPFPLLELRFSDLHGQLIASRRFKPGEYLAGELAGAREIPPQTPIHIALDILDPGPAAVNYRLDFKPPEEE